MKKQTSRQKPKKDESSVTLGDLLNQDLMKQLKEKQRELKAEEERKSEADEQRKREERRLREKNKSFEELLGESSLDWKKFK